MIINNGDATAQDISSEKSKSRASITSITKC